MDFFKKLEEESNIYIEWEFIESQDYGQKKNLILASGDYPDAFFNGVTDTDLNTHVSQGVFLPINEYLQYAPNLSAVFEEHPDFKKLCTYFDGNIYSIGYAAEDPCQYQPDEMYVYKPWLDKLGLEIPETTEEFYQMLKAFKEQDPNGNGLKDEIPFSATPGGARGFHSLSGAFGPAVYFGDANNKNYENFVYEDGGKIHFGANTEEWKNFIKYCNQMFSEGLFDQEIFTQDAKQYFAKGKTDEVTLGCFTLWNAPNMVGAERAADYVVIPTMEGPNGDRNWCNYLTSNGTVRGSNFAITTACEKPEILVRWLDLFYDKKVSAEALWGPVEEKDGMYMFVPYPEGSSFDEYRYQNSPVFGPGAVFTEDFENTVEMPEMMVDKMNEIETYYNIYPKTNMMPILKLTEEETDWMETTGADIITYVYDNMAKWMMKGGIDEEWDDYLKQLEKLGVERHLEVLQGAYDRDYGA
ncbi:extracellular solute-binding protein [Eisenbergiella sp.]|nr:extracellular solute-binding protein [Eisenbergiella sp.]MBS5535363.1 extracellular solute-binding protein [Lachnospiraceae bacterium]